MRILFCNIAWMKEYRGNEDGKDTPLNGGSYVDETGDAHEKYNFTPVNIGVLPVNRTIKNNKFLYRQPNYGWRYFYATFVY